MSYKISQLFPRSSTRSFRTTMASQDSCEAPRPGSQDIGFLQSWFEDELVRFKCKARINWGAIGGIALSVAVSASCWVGIARMLLHIWR